MNSKILLISVGLPFAAAAGVMCYGAYQLGARNAYENGYEAGYSATDQELRDCRFANRKYGRALADYILDEGDVTEEQLDELEKRAEDLCSRFEV